MGLGKVLGGILLGAGAIVAAPIVLPAAAAAAATAGTAIATSAVGTAIAGAATTAGAAIAGSAVGTAVTTAGAAIAGSAVGTAAAAAGTAIAGAAGAAGTAIASSAVGTAVTAAGSAAVGAVTAASSAVVGAAGTAGAAIAGTAVGHAAIGTATAAAAGLGSAVGTAAGAAGLSSVAALTGTTAGAAAVGTITAAGAVGTTSAISGASKLAKARDIKDEAMSLYQKEENAYNKSRQTMDASLEKLGKYKVSVWSSFDRFVTMYSKIKNPPTLDGEAAKDSIGFTKMELEDIKAVAIGINDVLTGGIGSIEAGSLIGLAAAGGLKGAIVQASTGTAINQLYGAAASKATLAAFGGGAITAGGAGMAGGMAVLNALNIAPMVMVGGIALNSKGKHSLENAKDIAAESKTAIDTMKTAEVEMQKVQKLSNSVRLELTRLNKIYEEQMDQMEQLVDDKPNYKAFTLDEKKLLERTTLIIKMLKTVCAQKIVDAENNGAIMDKNVNETLHDAKTLRESFCPA